MQLTTGKQGLKTPRVAPVAALLSLELRGSLHNIYSCEYQQTVEVFLSLYQKEYLNNIPFGRQTMLMQYQKDSQEEASDRESTPGMLRQYDDSSPDWQ
ncbi:hypothetical protein N7447_007700 [Penicillium robsamsonii]|uniref:uncharacterized protein n=1 Tax=Penicillium robsamsonii TaxID=1792511 RepID=UPI002549502B|nr:uncharacterized protein N7447_007700 [Penicillium robsamsonii]KAJ5817692.1 hypothetical protein N7447_007700 [Penicillium robsamsonii]